VWEVMLISCENRAHVFISGLPNVNSRLRELGLALHAGLGMVLGGANRGFSVFIIILVEAFIHSVSGLNGKTRA